MTSNLLENSDTTVFWAIPPGKPNPAEPFPGVGVLDSRTRIDAPGQKNETCTYYTFNFFRPRIGKHPDSDQGLRHIEQLFSEHRKKHTALLNQKDRELRMMTCMLLQKYRQPIAEYSDISKSDMASFLLKFTGKDLSPDKFSDHILISHNLSIISLNEELLSALAFDLNTFTQKFLTELQLTPQPYKSLPNNIRLIVSSSAITFARLKNYPQLGISNWTIKDGPQSLMDEMRQFGPISVRGYYGNEHYPPASLFSMKALLCEHTLFAWKPNTRIEIPEGTAVPTHSIVVTGMKKDESNKFFVLFIDPADESKVDSRRKIYLLSYDLDFGLQCKKYN